MVSTLAAQLQSLREGGAGSKRKTDTFLYDPREAAQIDDETVYNLAWNGLLELQRLDAAFEALDPSRDPARLFSRQRIHFHRVQLTADEDRALDAALTRLLELLSPYFLLGAAHKVLEYLVRRFEIHRHNVDATMAMILSYHESTWFARMVRILHIHHTRWEFLLGVKQTETPLPRGALVQRARDESSVVEFLFDAAARIGPAHPKLISLYALVVLELLELEPIREPLLRWLIPELLVAVKTQQYPEMQAAAYMILTKLASKAVLSAKVVEALVKHLIKYAHKVGGGAQMNALLCAIYLAETQPAFALTPSVGKYLVAMDQLVEYLGEVAGNYESVKFIRCFVTYLLDHVTGAPPAPAEDDNAETQDVPRMLLLEMIPRVGAIEHIIDEMVEGLLERAAAAQFDLENGRVAAWAAILVALSKKYVDRADASVQVVVARTSESATKKQKKQLNKFLERTFGQVANSAHFVPAHTDARTSLALALDHPTEHTRFQALQTLDKQHRANADTTERVLTSPGILWRRLGDESPRIVKFVLASSLGGLLLELSTKKRAFDALVAIIQRWAAKATEAAVTDALMQFLVGPFRERFTSDFDAKILVLALSVLQKAREAKTEAKAIDKVWTWIAALEHPLAAPLKNSGAKDATRSWAAMAEALGSAVTEKELSKLLPFLLSWTQPSDVNAFPLTPLLVPVLHRARRDMHQNKKARSKAHKEHLRTLDEALRGVLRHEFARLCALQEGDAVQKLTAAGEVAEVLAEVAADTFVGSVEGFDACIMTLLESPAQIFAHIQGTFVQIFTEEHGLEGELLPTMARVLVAPYPNTEDADLLVVLAKIRALDIVQAMLEGFDEEDEDEVRAIVPAVLVALGDAEKKVRNAALSALSQWLEAASAPTSSSTVSALAELGEYLINARGDVLLDARAITTLCGAFASENNASASQFAELVVDLLVDSSEKDLGIVTKQLELLTEVHAVDVWTKTIDYAQQLLGGLSSDEQGVVKHRKQQVLKILLSHYLGALVTDSKRAPNKALFDVILSIFDDSDKSRLTVLAELQTHTLSIFSEAYFNSLDEVTQHTLTTKLLHLLMVAEEAVASQLIRCLSELPLTAAMFVRLLNDEVAAKAAPGSAASKTRHHRTGSEAKNNDYFQDLNCVLEVLTIKVDEVASESDSTELLKSLTDVLALLCRPEHTERVSEYLLQIVFGCLRRVCEVHAFASTPQPETGKRKSSSKRDQHTVEPEHLVKHTLVCLGRTTSPQTRNEALLFISSLVNVYPTSVLNSLDKILSFVSGGAIHQDDDYSFNVLETIIKAVVPHILKQEAESGEGITCQQFIRLFVDAYNQIPAKRRELVFQVLVQALGAKYLPCVVLAILQNGILSEQIADLEDRTKFAHQLVFSFDAVGQVSGLVEQLRLVRDLYAHVSEDSETDTDEMDDEDDEDEPLSEAEKFQWDPRLTTSREIARALNLAAVKFIPVHLQARELHHEILKLDSVMDDEEDAEDEEEPESPTDRLQQRYLLLAQTVLLYFRRVAQKQTVTDDVDGESTTARGFWGELAQHTIDVLGSLQQLLSTPGFVAVIGELLHHDNSLVRKKAMQLFNERLQDDRTSLSPGEELLFVDMVEELDAILRNEDNSENSVNIQTALLSVDILARNFAAQHTKRFQAVLPTIIKYVEVDLPKSAGTGVSPMTLHLMGCAFVSLSSICRAVGPLVFPFLPKFFPNLLAAVDFCATKSRKSASEASSGSVTGLKTVLQCLLAALDVFTDHIPQFLTPYLSKIVQVLLTSSLLSAGAVGAATQQLSLSVDSCFVNLTNHVDLRHLLPNLFGAYEFALTLGDRSIEALFSVVSNVVSELNTADLRQYLPQFARFFVTCLDLRRVHAAKLQDMDAVEDEVLEVLVQFILRLSEKQLKPLFLKIVEWSQHLKTAHGDVARKIVLFKLLVKLSERLKSIFVPYYAHVLEVLTKALRESREVLARKPQKGETDEDMEDKDENDEDEDDDDDDDFFARDEDVAVTSTAAAPSRKKRKLANGHADVAVSRATYLVQLQIAVRALNGCFVHDSEGFTDKERFEVVMQPLVDVVDIVKHTSGARAFVFETVAECVANFAWAAKNDLLWKPLHYAVLMKSRQDAAPVRLATLKIIDRCYQVIGDEFLAMLPESIPFLSELMEDNDPEVERTCHEVIKQIEEISGESLDQYLTA